VNDARPRAEIVIVQTTVPEYRLRFFASLADALGSGLEIVSGEEDFALDVRHAHPVGYWRVRNRFLARRRLLWQSGVLRRVVGAPTAVLVLNPRILSNWFVLLARRARGRRTILWGHAWPRRGRGTATDRVRRFMRRLADTLIVYTEAEADELRALDPGVDVVAAPNALYPSSELGPAHTELTTDFLFVGRLNEEKKPALLLAAFLAAEPELPDDVRVVFLGDGPLRGPLEERARVRGDGRVVFLGHVSDTEQLRSAYGRAIASVAPGTTGLSLIQSLGFGVPMILVREALHGPETEAATEGANAVYVAGDSVSELANALKEAAATRDAWRARRAEIAAPIVAKYSVDAMVQAFLVALRVDVSRSSSREPNAHPRDESNESRALAGERSS